MSFFEELNWRGMLQDYSPGVEDILKDHKIRAYIGFDPTAPSLTIGNYNPDHDLKILPDAWSYTDRVDGRGDRSHR